jgi:hypothetical protein
MAAVCVYECAWLWRVRMCVWIVSVLHALVALLCIKQQNGSTLL